MRASNTRYAAELALVGAAFLFGSTFVLVQHAVVDVTPMAYLVGRFVIGTIVLAPFAWQRIRGMGTRGVGAYPYRDLAIAGSIAGLMLFAGYALQTEGLKYTSSSSAAFITGLYVPLTPILDAIVRRRRPPTGVILGVAVATVGLFLLTGAHVELGKGDALTLACAFAFALWLVYQNRYIERLGAIPFTTIQMMVLVIVALPPTAAVGVGKISPVVVFAVLFTGVACSAVALSLQLYAQQRLGPSRTALLLLLEPVFAGIVGYFNGDRLGAVKLTGAGVILAGIALSERRPTMILRGDPG
jgi:drug/metabolite transporter (DMT)-like permease